MAHAASLQALFLKVKNMCTPPEKESKEISLFVVKDICTDTTLSFSEGYTFLYFKEQGLKDAQTHLTLKTRIDNVPALELEFTVNFGLLPGEHLSQYVSGPKTNSLENSTRWFPPKTRSRSVWFLMHSGRLIERKPLSYTNLPTRCDSPNEVLAAADYLTLEANNEYDVDHIARILCRADQLYHQQMALSDIYWSDISLHRLVWYNSTELLLVSCLSSFVPLLFVTTNTRHHCFTHIDLPLALHLSSSLDLLNALLFSSIKTDFLIQSSCRPLLDWIDLISGKKSVLAEYFDRAQQLGGSNVKYVHTNGCLFGGKQLGGRTSTTSLPFRGKNTVIIHTFISHTQSSKIHFRNSDKSKNFLKSSSYGSRQRFYMRKIGQPQQQLPLPVSAPIVGIPQPQQQLPPVIAPIAGIPQPQQQLPLVIAPIAVSKLGVGLLLGYVVQSVDIDILLEIY
ncbi:hypothetical protein Tco_1102811 [Tanacetum coccineum]